MGAVCLVPALVFAFLVTTSVQVTIDAETQTLELAKEHLIGSPTRKEAVSFDQVLRAVHKAGWGGRTHQAELLTTDGDRVILKFGSREDEAQRIADKIAQWLGPREAVIATSAEATYEAMLRKIRSWSRWLLGLGIIHLVAGGFLSAPWGILLLIVGTASLYFREAAIFVIYSVTLAWAAVGNLLSGKPGWFAFALLQVYLAVQVFGQFRRFRQAQEEYIALLKEDETDLPPPPRRAERFFPWASLLLGLLSLTGLIALFAGAFLFALFTKTASLPKAVGTLETLIVNLAVLGVAVGLAALLSGYRRKLVAGLGLAASALVLILEFTLVFLVG